MKKVNVEINDKSYATREALNTLRTNIQFCGDDKKVIMLTSCLPGEGKTNTAIELAYSFTELNKSVLLIDADMRKSVMVARLQAAGADKGLSHFLSGMCKLGEAVVSTNIPKMHLLLSGPTVPNPTELISSNRFEGMMESFRTVYDYIIVDTPPLGLVIDSAIIARSCDGAVLVLEAGRIKRRLAKDVTDKLSQTGCPILGTVLNKVNRKSQSYYGKEYVKKNGYYTSGSGKK